MKKPLRMMKEWREFELLVSRIEASLKPHGFIFKSPDKLLDYDTDELREVDCSIRYEESGIEKLISIECRKRRGVQDVIWIEQLACKMDSLKLQRTIAVSSKGFSRAARLKAQKRGITLNTYKEFSEKDILEGIKAAHRFKHASRQWTLVAIEFETQDDSPDIPEELMQQFQHSFETGLEANPVLSNRKTNEVISLGQIVEECLAKSKNTSSGKRLIPLQI